MKRFDLFQRFFLLTVAMLFVGCGILLLHFYSLQRGALVAEWRADLEQETRWLGLHTDAERVEALANAWTITHSNTRLSAFDDAWRPLADSHSGALGSELEAGIEAAKEGEKLRGLMAVAPMRSGGWIVLSRPVPPGLSATFRWEMAMAVVGVVGLVAAVIYPFSRSMSSALHRMRSVVGEVAAGHYGKTVELERGDELGDLADAFDEMSAKLAEAEHLRTRLLHDVSHELRSPLGRIRVLAETLENKPDRRGEYLAGIAQEVDLLDRIVGDLLQAARIEAGLGTERRPTRLVEWSHETLARFAAEMEASGVAWSVTLPEEEIEVPIDRRRLTQAISNLVDNSLRAVRAAAQPRIDVEVSIEADAWRISVTDNGRGIAAENLDHVFRRFYRVGTDRDRESGSVGLGLSVVRAVARSHGGDATIHSEKGAGTRVVLEFPRHLELGTPSSR